MVPARRQYDLWRWPALCLWMLLLTAGLFPEKTFFLFRDWGQVMTQDAAINSPWVLIAALTAYLAGFTYFGCRNAGIDPVESQGKALQIAIVAMLAFLPLRLEQYREYFMIPVATHRRLLLTVCAAKGLAWVYLLSVILRYYAWKGWRVFERMPSLFPSVHRQHEDSPAMLTDTSRHESAVTSHKDASTENGKSPETSRETPYL